MATGACSLNTYLRDGQTGKRKGSLRFECYMCLILSEFPIIIRDLQVVRPSIHEVSHISLSSKIEGSDVTYRYSSSDPELKFIHPSVTICDLLSPYPQTGLVLKQLAPDGEPLTETLIPYRSIFPKTDADQSVNFSLNGGAVRGTAFFPIIPPRVAQLVGSDIQLAPNMKEIIGEAQKLFPGFILAPNLPQDIPACSDEHNPILSLRGWEERTDLETGVCYFAYRNTKQTTFVDPRGLPPGWEQRITEDGHVYFYRSHDATSTSQDPRCYHFAATRGL